MKYDNLPNFVIMCCNGELLMSVDGNDISDAFKVSFEYGGLDYPHLKVERNYIGTPQNAEQSE